MHTTISSELEVNNCISESTSTKDTLKGLSKKLKYYDRIRKHYDASQGPTHTRMVSGFLESSGKYSKPWTVGVLEVPLEGDENEISPTYCDIP